MDSLDLVAVSGSGSNGAKHTFQPQGGQQFPSVSISSSGILPQSKGRALIALGLVLGRCHLRQQSCGSAVRLNRLYLKNAIICVTATFIVGCTPSAEEFSKADFGSYPDRYSEAVDDWMNRILIDPDSKKVEITSGPQKYFWAFSNPKFAYLVCGTVNSRNRMGGYSGRSAFWAMIRNARVVSGGVADTGKPLGIAPPPCGE